MTKDLNLSATQVEKIKAINLKYANQKGELFKSKDRSGMRDRMDLIRTHQATAVKKVLTEEQRATYLRMGRENGQGNDAAKQPQN